MTKRTAILIAFVLAKFILQYFMISPEYDLHRDEFLHLDQAGHLAWGFASVPPVTSWISYIIAALGNGVFWVKFFPCLFGALTIVVVWKTIESLGGDLYALILGATGILLSVLLRINTLYQPNSLDILFWTTFYYVLIRYIQTATNQWLYIAAIVVAFAFLNKYNFVFLLLGLLPAILLSEQRRVFVNKHFYIAMLIALLLISPNLLWQYRNDFPVFHHLDELARTQLVNVNRADFLKEQLLFFIGCLLVVIAGLWSLAFYRPFRKYRLFFSAFVFTLLIFLYFKAKGYYAIGLYPVIIGFGAVYIGQQLQSGWKRVGRPVLIIINLLLFIPLYRVAFPNVAPEKIISHPERYKSLGLLRWEDGKDHELPQDFADMLGWKELATKVDKAFLSLPSNEYTMVIADNYGEAGAINYYSAIHQYKAVSFNADYINWFQLDKPVSNVILVKWPIDKDRDRTREQPLFNSIVRYDSISNPLAREYRSCIYILRQPKTDINALLRKELMERR